jgi:hypothetical protein
MKDILKLLAIGAVYLICFVLIPIVTGVARHFNTKYY